MKDFCVGITSEDINAIHNQLEKWINNPEPYDRLVSKAFEYAMREGTISAMTEKTIITYRSALKLCGNFKREGKVLAIGYSKTCRWNNHIERTDRIC